MDATQLIEAKWRIYVVVNYASLIQIMACRLIGAKPISEPVLYCYLDILSRSQCVKQYWPLSFRWHDGRKLVHFQRSKIFLDILIARMLHQIHIQIVYTYIYVMWTLSPLHTHPGYRIKRLWEQWMQLSQYKYTKVRRSNNIYIGYINSNVSIHNLMSANSSWFWLYGVDTSVGRK